VNVIRRRNNRVKNYSGIAAKELMPINRQWRSSAAIFLAPLDQNQTHLIALAYPLGS
jgi:hypothetical protein